MSVSNVILFYSRKNNKSIEMKNTTEIINGFHAISLDSEKVRNIINSSKFKIKKIPSIIVLYSSGQYKIYDGLKLDNWFEQLLDNISLQQPESFTPMTKSYNPIKNIEEDGRTHIFLPKPGENIAEKSEGTLATAMHNALEKDHIKQKMETAAEKAMHMKEEREKLEHEEEEKQKTEMKKHFGGDDRKGKTHEEEET